MSGGVIVGVRPSEAVFLTLENKAEVTVWISHTDDFYRFLGWWVVFLDVFCQGREWAGSGEGMQEEMPWLIDRTIVGTVLNLTRKYNLHTTKIVHCECARQ